MAVQVRHLFKSFGEHTVLRDFSIDIPDGTRNCVMRENHLSLSAAGTA